MIVSLVYLLLFLVVALVSGNSIATCSGGIICGRIVGRKTGITIAILGYVAGFLIEGGLLKAGITALLPVHSQYLVIIALAVVFITYLLSHWLRVPQSLPVTFAMALIGVDLAFGSYLSPAFVTELVLFWVLSAIAAALLTVILRRWMRRVTSKAQVWGTAERIKMMLMLLSFFSAFAIGANTIGLLSLSVSGITNYAYAIIVILLAIIAGSVMLSAGELRRIGDEILPLRYLNVLASQLVSVFILEAATILSIPVSSTQIFTSSLYGAGLSYHTRLIRKKPMLTIIYSWMFTALISLALGYIATAMLHAYIV